MPNQTKIAGKVLDCGEASIYVQHCLSIVCLGEVMTIAPVARHLSTAVFSQQLSIG